MNRAILVVAFGTSVPQAQKAFDHIDRRVKKAFPDTEIRWAYTSRTIRAKLARQGIRLDSPEIALARLMDEAFTHAAVLSLHTIPGIEFHELCRNAKLFGEMSGGFQRILVAPPLLSSQNDLERVAKALIEQIPKTRKPDEPVLFMGHGSKNHPADALYSAMNWIFQDLSPHTYVATVQGHPALIDILPKLQGKNLGKVYLLPFMAVAGEHARKDMAGEDPESWKSVLTRNGFRCEIMLTGTAEYPEIVEIWLDHLRDAVARL
ncbi:sirohydrochlorin cobaltochelatase [Desulfoferrobacter suflitae]|uniref:sirohydrochlorin cobaltochelatase n=1 Tax=Desulfoferrobacter suflitae TaxID=2865782 RepID=UPI002164EF6A|nr:sirohydrochlorin cobaltochelatase [Desulfoferrobacter suflitae]MCK8600463.1 sirohydrochlorin cobaltochelatase [Desulfoferrobacter suflitae]